MISGISLLYFFTNPTIPDFERVVNASFVCISATVVSAPLADVVSGASPTLDDDSTYKMRCLNILFMLSTRLL